VPAREKDRERCDPARDPSPVPLKGASRAHRQRRPEVALAIEALLQDLGHSVVGTAETGRDALAAAAMRPDLAIRDIRRQDRIGGAEVVGEMRERCGVRSILLTRHLRSAALRRLQEAEPLDIVTMPFYQERLRLAVLMAGLRHGCANPCEALAWNRDPANPRPVSPE
jgi:CheY-like chemotaxis protein